MKELEHDLTMHFYLEDNILFRNAMADDKELIGEH
jgi:iron-sulfur cluster repair protein YtfE (RIC family)